MFNDVADAFWFQKRKRPLSLAFCHPRLDFDELPTFELGQCEQG
jgi:hypothetical protein